MLLFITAIHITLYAKYKAGNYTIYNAEDDMSRSPMLTFPNILFVSVRNVPFAVAGFKDVAQVEREKRDDIQYVQKGDTLQITGMTNQEGFRHPVVFHLPPNVTLSVFNSSLSFQSGKRTKQPNPIIYLDKSRAYFSGKDSPLRLDSLKITAANGSSASFQGNTQVNHLDLQLSNSGIEAPEGDFGQLSIVTDSLSRISLQSKLLLKAAIRTSTPQ